MNRLSLFIIFFLVANIVSISGATEFSSYSILEYASPQNKQIAAMVSATMTGPSSVCLNSTNQNITFTGINGKPPYTFEYKIDDILQPRLTTLGSDSSISILINTSSAKDYTFTLDSVFDATPDRQAQLMTQNVKVNELPAIDFSFDICSTAGVKFTPSLLGDYTYDWNFGDTTTSNDKIPVHLFNIVGNGTKAYTVRLTVTDNATSCQNTITKSVNVTKAPVAALDITGKDGATAFDPSQQIFINCGATTSSPICDFTAVNASSTSAINTGYQIDWGDGTNESLPASFTTIKHKYTSLGFFDLKVTANNSVTGCSITKVYKFFNGNTPAGNLRSIPNTQDCIPYTLVWPIDGAEDNTPGTTYIFSVDDGSTSQTFTQANLPTAISHTFTKSSCGLPGNKFTVSFKVVNPCENNYTTLSVLSTQKPVASFNISSVYACLKNPVDLRNTSIGSYSSGTTCMTAYTKIWSISPSTGWTGTLSNSDDISVVFTVPGDYAVKLKIIKPNSTESRCTTDSLVQTIHVKQLPTATIAGTIDICQGSTLKPDVTFTGANGTAPYTFSYTLNGIPKSVKTTSGNSVTVPVTTTVAGTFNYTLVSVQEGSLSACFQAQVGTAVVKVNPLPTATVIGSDTVCLNSAPSPITFTGANGTPPYTFTYNLNGGPTQTKTTASGNSVTLQAPATVAGTFKYNLVSVQDASSTACSQLQTSTATIIVNPLPASMTLTNQEFCNGVMTPVIPFSNSLPGTTYAWTNSEPAIGLVASGTGEIPAFMATNNTSAPLISTIAVIPSANGCPGAIHTFTITVNPSAAVTFSPGNQTVCSGENTNAVTLTSTTPGATFSWSAVQPSGITGVATSGSNSIPVQTLLNSTDAPISVIYKATATIPGGTPCAGAEYTYTIVVNPTPVVSTVFKDTICSGNAFSFTPSPGNGNVIPTGTKYTWTAPVISPAGSLTGGGIQNTPQTTISQTLESGTPGIATATYTVTPIVNGCSGSTFNVVVTVNPKITVNKPVNITLCNMDQSNEIILTGNAPGTVYTWSSDNLSIGINSSGTDKIPAFTATNTGNSPSTAIISVVPTFSNGAVTCSGGGEQFSITVNPTAQVDKPSSPIVCDGQPVSVNFTTKNLGGVTSYAWTNDNTAISLGAAGDGNIAFTALNSTTTPITANITVTPSFSNGGVTCTGLPEEFTITVNPKGQVDNPGNQLVCKDQSVEVNFTTKLTGSGTTSFSWTNDNANIGLGNSGSGNLSFSAKNSGMAPITGKITVTPTYTNGVVSCPGTPQQFDITVNPSASITFSPTDQALCTGDNSALVTLQSTTNGVTFDWTAVQPAGITGVITSGTNTIPVQKLVNSTNSPITIGYHAKATISGSTDCSGVDYVHSITVNPRPVVANSGKDTICSNDIFTFLPVDGGTNVVPAATKYTWGMPVVSPAGALTGSTAQNTPQPTFAQTLTNTTTDIATATYLVTPEAYGCTGLPFNVTFSVNPTPNVTPLADITLCNGEQTAEIVLSGNVPGTIYKWSNSTVDIGLGNAGIDKIPQFIATNAGNTPLTATITVTPTYVNGGVTCDGTPEHFTITVNPTGQVNNPGTIEACNGTNSTLNFSTKNTGGTTVYSWTNTNTAIGIGATGTGDTQYTPVNNGVTPISGTITVTPTFTSNGISCQGAAEQFSIHVNPTPTVELPLNQTVCNSYPTSAVLFLGNVPGTIYTWNNDNPTIGLASSGTGDISPFAAVNNSTIPIVATITVTPVLNGCNGISKSFTITVNPSPIFTSQPQSVTLCKDETTVPLSVSYKNSVTVPTYKWFSNTVNSTSNATEILGATTANYIPSTTSAGTMYYYCVLTFPTGGCSSLVSDIAVIKVNPYPVISQYNVRIGTNQTFSFDPGTITGNIVPAGTTYTWSMPVVEPASSITGALDQSVPQSGISQVLTNPTTGVATATYTVSPMSGVCKGADFKIVVTVNPSISPNITQQNVDCFGAGNGSLTTAIEGGIPYATGDPYLVSWTGPAGFSSDATTISGLSPGVYTLNVSDSGGLPFSMNYTITEPDDIHLETITTKNVSCFNAANGEIAVKVTGGTLPYAYAWLKDGVPYTGNSDLADLSPGNYTLSVTDKNNCGPKTASFVITEPTEIRVTIDKQINVTCFGDSTGAVSVSVSGGVPVEDIPGASEYACLWSGPGGFVSSAQTLTHLVAGEYHLTVTDNTGCTQSFTATITQPDELNVNPVITPVTCYGENNASIQLNLTGGFPPYQLEWSNLGSGLLQENLSPGTYTVTLTDFAACSRSFDIVIDEAAFSIRPDVKQITCFGAHNGSINLNIQGGIRPIKLTWTDNPTAGNVRNQLGPGTYTAILSDASSCVIRKSFSIIEPVKLNLSAAITNAFDCNNPNSGAIALTIAGGTEPYSYLWTNGQTSKNLSGIQGGKYGFTVTDANGCSLDTLFEVIRPLPIALSVLTVPTFDCQTQVETEVCTAHVKGGIPPYQFTWSVGTTSGLNHEFMETTQSGIIMLGVIDGRGCSANYTFNLTVPIPGIDSRIIDCDAHVIGFTATIPDGLDGDYTYSWNFGDGETATIENPQHTYAAPGIYTVKLVMKNATCSSVYTKNIQVDAPPTVVLDKLPIFCTGDSLLLHVSGAASYRWGDGSTADHFLVKKAGDYLVTGTSIHGCTFTLHFTATNFDTFNYTIQSDRNDVTTDNPILQLWSESISYSDYFWDFGDNTSAEGNNQRHSYNILKDGYYDVKLKVKNPNGCVEYATKRIWITDASMGNVFSPGYDGVFLKGFHIQVYNRNGFLLYDGDGGWNGNYNGNPVTNDTYFYVLYLSGESGVKTKSGFVTVVR